MRNNISDQVKKAFEAVKSGGVILYPTDTVWGLGCDATNCKAIAKLNKIKKRDDKKPMLSLVKDVLMIKKHIKNIPNNLEKIISDL